jgi:hypothetical protein
LQVPTSMYVFPLVWILMSSDLTGDRCKSNLHAGPKCPNAMTISYSLMKEFLSSDDCKLLIFWIEKTAKPHNHAESLKVSHSAIDQLWPVELKEKLVVWEQQIRKGLQARFEAFAKETVSQYRFAMIHGKEGYHCPRHTDFCDWTAIVYLSRPGLDYEGGHFHFISDNKQDSESKPLDLPQGSLLLFRSTSPHFVTQVKKGERFIFNIYYSLQPDKAKQEQLQSGQTMNPDEVSIPCRFCRCCSFHVFRIRKLIT